MKNILLLSTLFLFSLGPAAQERKNYLQLYDTTADIPSDINAAIKRAAQNGKNVLLQIGGNWCIWCKYFHTMVSNDTAINALLQKNYEVVYVAYEKDNKDNTIWAQLGYPQRFGFPVFVVLNDQGKRLHTQNSVYLEEGKGYHKERVMEFLKQWSVAAVNGTTTK